MKRFDVLCAGLIVADLFTSPLERLPQAGMLSTVDDISLECGGCAANVAINLAKLGQSATLAGRVGNDVFGQMVLRELQSKGPATGQIRISDTWPTSKTVILVVKGEDRRYVHAVGANGEFGPADIDRETIRASKVFYVGGLMAMKNMDCEQLVPLFRLAREAGTVTVLDVVVPAGTEGGLDGLAGLLPYTDVFLPNEDEGRVITGCAQAGQQAQIFRELGARCVVVTRGGAGSIALSESAEITAGVYPIEAVDASGGGDAFTSGFIYGELQNWPLAQKLRFASAMGASACRMRGCTTGTFTLEEAHTFIDNHRLPMAEI